MPWGLPWVIDALPTALAWEVVASCEQWEQLVPRRTIDALKTYAKGECGTDDGRWLDGEFSKNTSRIMAEIAEDISRVQPRPSVLITSPDLSEEDRAALNELGRLLNIGIDHKQRLVEENRSAEVKAALRLLGSAGMFNANLGLQLIEAADIAGEATLATALSRLLDEAKDNKTTVFGPCTAMVGDERFAPVFAALRHTRWPADLPDWQKLRLPSLLEALWTDPWQCLDRMRTEGTRNLKSSPNAHHVRISIARHLSRCFVGDGLAARLDLLEASVESWNNRPTRAWQLLSVHANDSKLQHDSVLAAHIYGHAGRAASRLGLAREALELFERNLASLEPAFGADTRAYRKAQADLQHKIGQLLREHPELPGGFNRARRHIEQSLNLHTELRLARGVSMCLSEMGELSMSEGAFEDAKQWFERALEKDRECQNVRGESRLLHQLAILHERTGEFEQALHFLQQAEHAQRAAGISGNLRQRLLNTRERLEDMLGLDTASGADDPLSLLDDASSEEPQTFSTRVTQKARTLRQQGRLADGEKLLREALKRPIPEAHRDFLYLALANLMLDLRRHEEARKILQNASPQSHRTKQELALVTARLEFQVENFERAEELVDSYITTAQPEVLARIHVLRGRILFKQTRFPEAAREFQKSREYSRSSLYATRLAMEHEALSHMRAGEYQRAVDLARELARTTASGKWKLRQIRASTLLGDALLHLEQAREAAEEFERAIELAREIQGVGLFSRAALERRAARAWGIAGNAQAALAHIHVAVERLEEEDAPVDQRAWVYLLSAYLHRASGSSTEYESALHIAEQYARSSGSESLVQAVAIFQQGDWRHDNWSTSDFEWEEDDAPRSAIGRARRLRARRKLDEALETLAPLEQLPIADPVRREILELKLAILLDEKEMGRELGSQETLDQLAGGRSDADLTPKLLLLRARAEMLDRRYESAIETAHRAYKKGVELGEFFSIARAGSILSRALSEIGRQSEATSILQQIANYMQAQGRQQFAFDAKYSLCRHLINMRQFREARQYLQELTDSSAQLNLADWVRLQIAYAEIERTEGNSEAAIARLDGVLTRAEAEGRPELKAEADRLRQAILLDTGVIQEPSSDHPTSTAELRQTKAATVSIKSLRRSGRHQEALALAQQALETEGPVISRKRAILLHEAGICYFQGKEFEKAASICQQSLDLHLSLKMRSGTPGVRVTLARILANTANPEEARAQLLRALKENNEMRDQRGVEICQKLLAQFSGEAPSANRPETARELLVRATTLRHSGRMREAIDLIDQALVLAQAEGDQLAEARARGALGINRFKGNDFHQAEQYLRRAVELHSHLGSANLAECVHYLARTYLRLRRGDEAQRLVKETLSAKLNDYDRAKLREMLSRMEEENGVH